MQIFIENKNMTENKKLSKTKQNKNNYKCKTCAENTKLRLQTVFRDG